jgi:hypothetical protein
MHQHDEVSGAPGVQPYIDEVLFPVMSSTPFYDLENVQAVKGPTCTTLINGPQRRTLRSYSSSRLKCPP